MRSRTRRLYAVGFAAVLLAIAAGLTAVALRQYADLFYTPEMLTERGYPEPGQRVRIGGFVQVGSLQYGSSADLTFIVEDQSENEVLVAYTGITPDLFREGEGVVATGRFGPDLSVFEAEDILAKHDETYEPRELRDVSASGEP